MDRLHSYDDTSISFYNIDKCAKETTPVDEASFPLLIEYFERKIPHDRSPKVFLARALIAWICFAQTKNTANSRFNTPLFAVDQLKQRRMKHAEVFKQFCGYADIECEIVEGRTKAVRYKAGDSDSSYIQGHTWNAFKADDTWHLVHPQWCIHAIVGYVHGGERALERDGRLVQSTEAHSDGTSMYKFNSFWFCTNPEIFVNRCLPNDPKQQFLPQSKMIKSVHAFLQLPDLRQGFFDNELSLLSKKTCALETKEGKCKITMMSSKKLAKKLDFSYVLTLVEENNPAMTELAALVFHSRDSKDKNEFLFEVRCPFIGVYRLKIRIGYVNDDAEIKPNCCEFRINCTAVDPNCKKLPIDTGIAGWGHGHVAEENGIKKSSEYNAKVIVSANRNGDKIPEKTIKLKLDEEAIKHTDYGATLLGSDDADSDDIDIGFAEVTCDVQKCELSLTTRLKTNRECALVVNAKNKHGGEKSKPVLNYLMTTQMDKNEIEYNKDIHRQKFNIRMVNKKSQKDQKLQTLKTSFDSLSDEIKEIKDLQKTHGQVVGSRQSRSSQTKTSKACLLS